MHHLWLTRHVFPPSTVGAPLLIIHSGISDAYYCAECTRLEKDRDGCPKIVNLGASRTDLFYERRRLGKNILPNFVVSSLMPFFRFQKRLNREYRLCFSVCTLATLHVVEKVRNYRRATIWIIQIGKSPKLVMHINLHDNMIRNRLFEHGSKDLQGL